MNQPLHLLTLKIASILLLPLHLCIRINSLLQYICSTLYSQERRNKKPLSAAKAVIPCCQSPLYCRGCICSRLVLSIDGVGAADASVGTIMQPHKPAQLASSPHKDQRFPRAKGEEHLNKYAYPSLLWILYFHRNSQLHNAYSNIFSNCKCSVQVIYLELCCWFLFYLDCWFRAQMI